MTTTGSSSTLRSWSIRAMRPETSRRGGRRSSKLDLLQSRLQRLGSARERLSQAALDFIPGIRHERVREFGQEASARKQSLGGIYHELCGRSARKMGEGNTPRLS